MELDKKKHQLLQFIKFGLVGVSNACISFAVYSILVFYNIRYEFANLVGFSVSVVNAYYWNKKFVFKTENSGFLYTIFSFFKVYISYAITGLILQSCELKFLIDFLNLSKYLSQLICIIINLPINFILNKLWAFSSKKEKDKYDE